MVPQTARAGGEISGSILEGIWEHMGEGCWYREQQLLTGRHVWVGGRQIFGQQGNCLQGDFTRVLKNRPCREEKRETVAEETLEQKAMVSPAAGPAEQLVYLSPCFSCCPEPH